MKLTLHSVNLLMKSLKKTQTIQITDRSKYVWLMHLTKLITPHLHLIPTWQLRYFLTTMVMLQPTFSFNTWHIEPTTVISLPKKHSQKRSIAVILQNYF